MRIIRNLNDHQRKILRLIGQRCLWAYMLVAVFLMLVVNRQTVFINRVNMLKDVEEFLELSRVGRYELSDDTLRWGIRYYKALLQYASDNSMYHGNLGFCYYYLGKNKEAIAEYQKAISLEPFFYAHFWDLGMIYASMGDYQNAINALTYALNYIPITIQYYYKSAEVLPAGLREELSPFVVRLTTQARDDEEQAIVKLCNIYYLLKDYGPMKELAIQGTGIQPQSQKLHYNAGLSYFLLGDFKNAVQYLTEAIEMDSHDYNALYYRALNWEKLGQYVKGKNDLREIIKLKEQGLNLDQEEEKEKLHLNIELRFLKQQIFAPPVK